LSEVTEALQSLPGVRRVEDVHVWGLCSHLVSLSARVILDPARMAEQPRTLSALQTLLRDRFSIGHSTLQLEPAEPDARP
jgi:cobalt-zinc-cadmium efflux system protein